MCANFTGLCLFVLRLAPSGEEDYNRLGHLSALPVSVWGTVYSFTATACSR